MSLKKRVFRCGCNNAAISIPSVSHGNRTCCQNCTGAPCFYSIMSDCDVWMPNGEKLLEKSCTLLKKDCIQGCTWSSRWNAGNGSATIDFPIATTTTCDVRRCPVDSIITDGLDCNSDKPCPYRCFDFEITSADGAIGEAMGLCSPYCSNIGQVCNDSIGTMTPGDGSGICGTADPSPFPPLEFVLGGVGAFDGGCLYSGTRFCCWRSGPAYGISNNQFYVSVAFTGGAMRLLIYCQVNNNYALGGFIRSFWLSKTIPIACYSGTAGNGWPSSISSPFTFTVNSDEWEVAVNYCDAGQVNCEWLDCTAAPAWCLAIPVLSDEFYDIPSITATISPNADCRYVGTAGNASSNSPNISISVAGHDCHWKEDEAQGGACSLEESFIGPCSDNPPSPDRGWTGTAGTAGIDNWRKWVLTMNDSGATDSSSLVLRTREGYTATYTATALSCKNKTHFSLASYDSKLKFLPPSLCVAPIESVPENVCSTGTAQCACCDDGDDLYVSVVLSGCDGLFGTYSGSLPRKYDGDTLPCGVSYPVSAPCGVFTLQIGTTGVDDCNVDSTDWSEAVYLVFYCNGTGYSIDVYCWNNDTNCWVFQGQGTVTGYECRCYGPLFYFTLPSLDCCCQSCEDCTPPSTLYADLSSSCSGWTGTVTLTETAGTWQGSTGAPEQVVDVQLSCFEGNWVLNINAVNASCGIDTTVADSWECEPAFSASFTVALSSDCCPPSGGTLSVSVYE